MFSKRKENQLKDELKDLRHKYSDTKEDLKYEREFNIELTKNNDLLKETISKIKVEIQQNQYNSMVNFKNKIRKILADSESNLVSSNKN